MRPGFGDLPRHEDSESSIRRPVVAVWQMRWQTCFLLRNHTCDCCLKNGSRRGGPWLVKKKWILSTAKSQDPQMPFGEPCICFSGLYCRTLTVPATLKLFRKRLNGRGSKIIQELGLRNVTQVLVFVSIQGPKNGGRFFEPQPNGGGLQAFVVSRARSLALGSEPGHSQDHAEKSRGAFLFQVSDVHVDAVARCFGLALVAPSTAFLLLFRRLQQFLCLLRLVLREQHWFASRVSSNRSSTFLLTFS